MKATVIYNSQAGSIKDIPMEELEFELKGQGFYPVLEATDSEADLDRILAQPEGLVLAVGGDGTLRATILRLLGREGVELAFVPAGTANNVAHAFGLGTDWRRTIQGLGNGKAVSFDVGKVTGPLGEHYFLEAFGAGVYADTLANYDPEQGKSILRSIGSILDVLPNYEGQEWRIAIDGQEVSGCYVMLEALNTPMNGPHLKPAPKADPTDGLLDVVLIAHSDSGNLLTYARKLRAGELDELQNVTVTRCHRLELVWTGFPLHLDGKPFVDVEEPGEMQQARAVSPDLRDERKDVVAVQVLHGAIRLRLPEVEVSEVAEASGE
jgi:diacylglycerol kinase family enzyme